MNSKEFIENIMQKYNLNQNQLAIRVGILPNVINRWLHKPMKIGKGNQLLITTALKKMSKKKLLTKDSSK